MDTEYTLRAYTSPHFKYIAASTNLDKRQYPRANTHTHMRAPAKGRVPFTYM